MLQHRHQDSFVPAVSVLAWVCSVYVISVASFGSEFSRKFIHPLRIHNISEEEQIGFHISSSRIASVDKVKERPRQRMLFSPGTVDILEREALLSFKAGIIHDPRGILNTWSSSSDSFPCTASWAGITCHDFGTQSSIVSLDLRASNLTGSISPALANLSQLTYLNLSINALSGHIPPQLGTLGSLTHLDFKENNLTGPIPSELGNCSSLLWLDISKNELVGPLPASLGQLSKLYMLQIHDMPTLISTIPPQFGNLTNLTYLYLGSNSLIGNIPPELGQLANLKELYLMLNHLNGSIPSELGKLRNLEYLSLFMNSFEGVIPPQLGNLTNLQFLWILLSQLQGTIPSELGNLHNLRELDLSLNFQLSGSIPPHFGQLENLESLKLFQMNLSGSIPTEFRNLKRLQHLYLFSNALSGAIPPELGQLENLQDLHLYSNQLTGPLAVELTKLQKLRSLVLFSNHLHGDIPLQLGEMSNLRTVGLGENRFTGNLPSSIGNLLNLQYFEASPNYLTGSVPRTLGNLKKLIYLDLSKNRFSGTLPLELANCTMLQWIKLSNNSLTGEIPVHYASLPVLHSLALANNSLNGALPAAFTNLSSLVVLNLQHNNFWGQLPDAWVGLVNLRVLSLGYNYLEGPLPSWLWGLKQLQLVNLAQNNFSGAIISKISQMDGLKHNQSTKQVDLYQDDLTVDLKGSELYFKYLWGIVVSLDLSGNALTGVIPDDIGSLSGLYNLNLSDNFLTGHIPRTLGNVLTLGSLDLSNNMFSGQIPSQLIDLTSLAYLNLSNNHLSGVIPKGNQFNLFLNTSYLGNPGLCGYPLTKQCETTNTTSSTVHHRTASKLGIIMGCLSVIVFGSIIILITIWSRKRRLRAVKIEIFDKRINISVHKLSRATERYKDSNIIGRGGSSIVYRGTLDNGMIVAIKKLEGISYSEAEKSFLSEIATLGHIRHRNLVKIWGALLARHLQCLVLEYIPNGSLDMHLHVDPCNLGWDHLFNIALQMAHALTYLHEETGIGQVLHCDLKPSNILLDGDFEPHISDFGISRLVTSTKDSCITASLRGTIGYVAPECAFGEMTDKGDVYSYGIVLLEMLTRRCPTSGTFGDSTSLVDWVRSALPWRWMDIISTSICQSLTDEKLNHEVYHVLTLALSCVKENPRDRPSMRNVLEVLLHVKNGKAPYIPIDELILSTGLGNHGLVYFGSSAISSNQSTSTGNDESSDALLSH